MRFILVLLSVIITGSSLFAQQPADSDASRADYFDRQFKRNTERRARYDSILSHFNGDRAATKDSVYRYNTAYSEKEAQERIAGYKAHSRLDTVKVIDLSHARLKAIPDFVYRATSAERLMLDYNDLKKLPRKLRKLKKLKRLDWSFIQVPVNKARIPKIKSLEYLDLENNSFEKIARLKKMKSLQSLELSSNKFATIPVKALQSNKTLENLYLNKNPGLEIGRDHYGDLRNLTVLKLGNCDLTSIDESLYGINSLHELHFQENQLKSIPGGISNLKNLKSLSFYKNELTTLPADFYQLQNLEVVDLYYNRLRVLDTAISLLQNLQVLYLSNNDIYDIPAQISTLPKLRELYLAFNNLTSIPELKNLNSLKVLRIDHNNLYDFPNDLLYLTQLTYLDFSSNQISEIPLGLDASYPEMQLLYFRDNPIDFNEPENQYIAQMIVEMSQRGVVCRPSFSMEQKSPQ